MSEMEQLQQARKLIHQKRYKEAYAILNDLDHPKAREWLERLDRVVWPEFDEDVYWEKRKRNSESSHGSRSTVTVQMAKNGHRYGLVRFMANLLVVIGYAILALSILGGVLGISGGFFTISFGGIITGINFVFVGQLTQLMLEVVDNSREQRDIMQALLEEMRR